MRRYAPLLAGLLLLASTPVLAGDLPTYDRKIEQAVIARLQTKLPELRAAYDITEEARIPAKDADDATSWLSKLNEPSIMKYQGRIIWL